MAYTDAATVKSYLGNVPPANSEDLLIGGFVETAQAYIDGYCHQTFEAVADSTRYFDPLKDGYGDNYSYGYGYGAGYYSYGAGRRLYLDYPLCAITSVTNGDGAALLPADYVTEPRNLSPWFALSLKLSSAHLWTYSGSPENSIAIVGKWAYSLFAPADIRQAAMRLAAYLYRQRDNGFDLDRIIQTNNGTIMPLDIPRDIQKLLEPYKRIVV
jgi:hypothetical protein